VDWVHAIGDGSLSATDEPNKSIKERRAAVPQGTPPVTSDDRKAQAEYEERIHNWFNQDGNSDRVQRMCGSKNLKIEQIKNETKNFELTINKKIQQNVNFHTFYPCIARRPAATESTDRLATVESAEFAAACPATGDVDAAIHRFIDDTSAAIHSR
jgi:hypothetical protein